MKILNFIINEIFGQGAIFLALIALIGLILQKKSFSEILRGTAMTAIGFFVLTQGTAIITGKSIDGLAAAFNTIMPNAAGAPDIDMSPYGTQIGIVMVIGFLINLLVARFTKWKSVFLTGHMLYWFPYVFIAAGVNAGLKGAPLVILATIMTGIYLVVAPNLMKPLVKEVTGDDSFTIGHPTTTLSVISGYLGKLVGDKTKSTEDIKFPKVLSFLREVSITGSIVIALTYIVMAIILRANGKVPGEVWGYAGGTTGAFTYIFSKAIFFGTGVTVMLLGVRMLIAEIVPLSRALPIRSFRAIPALDCPVLSTMPQRPDHRLHRVVSPQPLRSADSRTVPNHYHSADLHLLSRSARLPLLAMVLVACDAIIGAGLWYCYGILWSWFPLP